MSRFAKLAIATVASTLLLIGLGGLVRATGSGLGCPDWPGCFGKVLPPAGNAHAWIEHIHRYWASVVIGLLIWLAVEARRSRQPRAVRRATLYGLIPIVVLQSILGALVVVKFLLHWMSVTGHLVLALAILGLATWVAVDALRREGLLRSRSAVTGSSGLALLTTVTTVLVFAQMTLGSMVTGFNSGLAYATFPSFNGKALPEFNKGYVFRQSLHVGHRVVGVALLAVVVLLLVRARRPGVDPVVRRSAQIAVVLVAAQVVLGALNIWWELSARSVVPHVVVGASLWIVMVVATVLARGQAQQLAGVDTDRVRVQAR